MLPHRLQEGYQSFLKGHFTRQRTRYQLLSEYGQKPDIMVISCCDSRVAPEIVFDAAPGELFVVRNVANLVPPCQPDGEYHGTSSALEFAVEVLNVHHIVVLGHAQCGGISAYAKRAECCHSDGPFLDKWIDLIDPAARSLENQRGQEDYLTLLELAVIENSLRNLMSFPAIKERVEGGSLSLHGAYFGISSGRLLVRNPQTGIFETAAGSAVPFS